MEKFYNPFEKIEPVIKALAELDTPLRPGWSVPEYGEYLWFNIPEEWLNKFGLTRE